MSYSEATMSIGLTLVAALLVSLWFMGRLYRKVTNYWPSRNVELMPVQSIIRRIVTGNFSYISQDVEMYTKIKEKGLKYAGFMELELWKPIFFPADLDLISSIMIKDFDHFSEHRTLATSEEPHLYNMLFNSSGEAWRTLRAKLTPAFTSGKIKNMSAIFYSSSAKLIAALKTKLGSRQSSAFAIRPYLQNVVMDIIANAVFGVQTDIFEDPENSAFNAMGHKVLQTLGGPQSMLKLAFINTLPKIAKLFKIRLMDSKADHFYSQIVRDVFYKRSNNPQKEMGNDFIQMLMEAKNKIEEAGSKTEMTEDIMIAQCMSFILGGFDNVEALLSWTTYELAVNPDIQKKLYNEIKAGVEGNGGKFSYDLVVNEFLYLDQVVQESLRKYPPFARVDRTATQSYKVPNSDLVLPKGSVVMIPIHAIHHDPEIYPEPDRFIPERFTKQTRNSRAFVAFGLGPRNCIGNRFGLAEAKFVLAHLILNFELSPCSETKIPPVFVRGVTLKPIDGIPLTLKCRN